ncbi:MAG: nucleotidyltransferase substrate binding protein [Pseudomonadota bacterium]
MADDIRWQQRFNNFCAAFAKLEQAVAAHESMPGNDLIQMALIKAFEMTFELSWKTLKDYLQYNGIDVKLPREVLKQAFANDIVEDGQVWIDMLEDRNLMAHTYNEARAQMAVNHIRLRYMTGLSALHQCLLSKLTT